MTYVLLNIGYQLYFILKLWTKSKSKLLTCIYDKIIVPPWSGSYRVGFFFSWSPISLRKLRFSSVCLNHNMSTLYPLAACMAFSSAPEERMFPNLGESPPTPFCPSYSKFPSSPCTHWERASRATASFHCPSRPGPPHSPSNCAFPVSPPPRFSSLSSSLCCPQLSSSFQMNTWIISASSGK